VLFSKAYNKLPQIALDLRTKQKTIQQAQSQQPKPTDFYEHYCSRSSQVNTINPKIVQAIKNEIDEYWAILTESQSIRENNVETKLFWQQNKNRFPYLSEAAMQLLNIPASSAFIERFFSLCGAICKSRCGNMTAQTIINRCMLKANMELLNNMVKR
jgi:hypothetical protein